QPLDEAADLVGTIPVLQALVHVIGQGNRQLACHPRCSSGCVSPRALSRVYERRVGLACQGRSRAPEARSLALSCSRSARHTFSAVRGGLNGGTPQASKPALATAAGVGSRLDSPIAFDSNGPGPLPASTSTVSRGGMSAIVGSLYSPRFAVVTRPSSMIIS